MSRILRLSVFAAAAVAACAWLAGCGADEPQSPRAATVLAEPRPLPEFSLTDHDGRPFHAARLHGRTTLLFFGFTHCPDICPATLAQLAAVRRQLAAAGSEPPQIVLVTVDPERDTPEVLGRYVQHFGEGIVGVTGPTSEIRALAEPLGLHFEQVPLGDSYTMGHSTAVLMVGPDGSLRALFSAPHDTDAFVHDLPILMARE